MAAKEELPVRAIKETPREWQKIQAEEKIQYLLSERLNSQPLYVKYTTPPELMIFNGFEENRALFRCNGDVFAGDVLTLYTTMNRQVEIDFSVAGKKDEAFLMRPVEARISRIARNDKRIAVPNEILHTDNFQIGQKLEPDVLQAGTVKYRIVYDEFEKKLRRKYGGASILTGAMSDRIFELSLLKNRDGFILVPDTGDRDQYGSANDSSIPYRSLLKRTEQLDERIQYFRNNGISSILVHPLAIGDGDDRRNFAYIYLEGRGDVHFNCETVEELRDLSTQLINRIEDVNIVRIRGRQKVLNLSEGGIALEVSHSELKRHIVDGEYMTFDLIFKKQPPLRFRGRCCYIFDFGAAYVVGISFQGASGSIQNPQSRLRELLQAVQDGSLT